MEVQEGLLRGVVQHLLAELVDAGIGSVAQQALAERVDQVAPERQTAAVRCAAGDDETQDTTVLAAKVVAQNLEPMTAQHFVDGQPARLRRQAVLVQRGGDDFQQFGAVAGQRLAAAQPPAQIELGEQHQRQIALLFRQAGDRPIAVDQRLTGRRRRTRRRRREVRRQNPGQLRIAAQQFNQVAALLRLAGNALLTYNVQPSGPKAKSVIAIQFD